MDITAEYSFDAPAAKVWEVMLDPDTLAHCMPGCENLRTIGEGQYEATISAGVGAIKGTFQVKITIKDQVPLSSYKLLLEGTGTPGFVNGGATIFLEEREGKTLVKVVGQAQVGGTIARVGSRLIGTVNRMMMDRFFTCLLEEASKNP